MLAVAVAALSVVSMYSMLAVSADLGFGHLHAASYQGRLAAVVGDDTGLRTDFIIAAGGGVQPPPLTHRSVGFRTWRVGEYGFGSGSHSLWIAMNKRPVRVSGFVIPHWLVFGPCLLFVATVLAHRRYSGAPGLCSDCGYDLRATSGPACPECGAAALAPPAEARPAE